MKNILLASAFYYGLDRRNRTASMNVFDGPKRIFAICIMNPDNDSGVNGLVKMLYDGKETRIQAKITGLEDGLHGFHIHQYGNLTEGCVTAGAHFNPEGKQHGGPLDEDRHVGDLGNITSLNKVAKYNIEDTLITLEGPHSVIGRSFVVHERQDDLGQGTNIHSKQTGNAGGRLACGVIGLSGPLNFE